MKWKVYYSDGSTFSDEDGLPEEAPGWGVVVIPQADEEVGRVMMCRWDHYCWHDGEWWGHDFVGLIDCLALPGSNVVLHGRTVDSDKYKAIHQQALDDPGFSPRSARVPLDERGEMQRSFGRGA